MSVATRAATDPQLMSGRRAGIPGNRGRVLVVVRDPGERDDLYSALDRRGYNVATSRTGVEALRYVVRDCPDLVVTDWRLGDLRGPVLVDFLRSISADVPIVALVPAGARDLEEARDEVRVFLEKPVTGGDLIRAVEAILGSPDRCGQTDHDGGKEENHA